MTVMGPPGGRHPVTIRDQAAVALAELPVHLRQIGISLQRLADQGEQHYYTLPRPGPRPAASGLGSVLPGLLGEGADYVWPCVNKTDLVGEEDHPPQFLVVNTGTPEEESTST